MKLVHVIDVVRETLIEVYFVDELTGCPVNYTIEEFLEEIRQ